MPFLSALKKFSENGFFELNDTLIFTNNIHYLEAYTKHLKAHKPDIPFCQIHLSNIKLIPGAFPRTEISTPILSGAMAKKSPRALKKCFTPTTITSKKRFTPPTTTQIDSINNLNMPLGFGRQETSARDLVLLRGSLLSLLSQLFTWNLIELDHVFFYTDHNINYSATEHFYNELLSLLIKNKFLKKLTIKPCSLTKHRKNLVHFLTQHTQLETLDLEINEANKQDWIALSQVLAMHPKLSSFNLGHSTLDANAYSALTNLLDENYRIDITLPIPTDEILLKAYEPLKQRLSKPGLDRFKEEHLSQTKLLQIAIAALKSLYQLKLSSSKHMEECILLERRFDFLLTNQSHRALTHSEKEDWVKSAEVLPKIYKHHQAYLKSESSLLQLHLDELTLDGIQTAGYILLEKTLAVENLTAMQTLLKAKINLFEFPAHNKKSFLVQALKSETALKKILVNYIKEQQLVERATEYLNPYPQLIAMFKEFKTHLNDDSIHCVEKDNSAILMWESKEILNTCQKLLSLQNCSEIRAKESTQIYLDLDKSLQIIRSTPTEIPYTSLDEVHEIVLKMKEDSIKAIASLSNQSFLHERILELINQFEAQLKIMNKNFFDKKDDIIIKIIADRERERTKFNEELIQEKAKFEKKFSRLEERLNQLSKQLTSNTQESPEAHTSFSPRP